MKVSLLGTGLMGAPMARHLARVHDLTVWNRSQARAITLSDVAKIAQTADVACAGAEVVITMLLDGPATLAVLVDDVMAAAAPGALIIDMGSVDPETDKALAKKAAGHGLRFVDAPVSGGVAGAEAASLAIFVGGETADFDVALPILSLLGRPTALGPVGAGQVAKLANQLIVATTIGAVAEAFHLAEAAGCDPSTLREALKGGFADSRILDLHGARMVSGNFTPGGRSVAQLKDLDNAMAVAKSVGVDLPLSQTVTAAFRDFVEVHNGGEMDHAAYFEWLSLRRS